MSEDRFLTKTKGVFLALTVLFAAGLWTVRTGQEPVRATEGYTVTTARGVEAAAERPAAPQEKINVNTASQEQLELLDGIGPVKAEAMVAYREENGKFTCAEDLLKVPGIGEATLEAIRDDITWEVTP